MLALSSILVNENCLPELARCVPKLGACINPGFSIGEPKNPSLFKGERFASPGWSGFPAACWRVLSQIQNNAHLNLAEWPFVQTCHQGSCECQIWD